MAYDNIKFTKKLGFTLPLENTVLEKQQVSGQIDPTVTYS